MFYTYIIQSDVTRRYYIGSSQDVFQRLDEHNRGKTKSTRHGIPWKIICYETFETRLEALRREKQIKLYKGGEAFKKLIK